VRAAVGKGKIKRKTGTTGNNIKFHIQEQLIASNGAPDLKMYKEDRRIGDQYLKVCY
jgi:hypothetical protein